MATKNGIGYSPLTERVYLGKQNKEKGMWVGEKTDITDDFLRVSHEFFKENTCRIVNCSNGESNIFINVKNDKEHIQKAINKLTVQLSTEK